MSGTTRGHIHAAYDEPRLQTSQLALYEYIN